MVEGQKTDSNLSLWTSKQDSMTRITVAPAVHSTIDITDMLSRPSGGGKLPLKPQL